MHPYLNVSQNTQQCKVNVVYNNNDEVNVNEF